MKKFEKKIRLASPTMHGDELKWVTDAFDKNWITTVGDAADFKNGILIRIWNLSHSL